jgi:pyrimidine deaminase RibD-like protein
MISFDLRRVVTLNGECFDIKYQGNVPGNRDGVLHQFHLKDVKTDRVLRASVYRLGTLDTHFSSARELDSRENSLVLNALRRAFDKGILSFEKLPDGSNYHEIQLESVDYGPQPTKPDDEVRGYMIQKAYYLSYLFPLQPDPSGQWKPIPLGDELDLDYLGIKPQDAVRNVRRLGGQEMVEKIQEDWARPTEKLLIYHESGGDSLRRFARMAIDQARKSVAEDNAKHHPKVGAVIVKDGRVLSEAHRGEIPGNHAEFIAMEVKLRDEILAGTAVFTTLEPCTTRTHPKVPCAERLIERKVTKVVIGMLDPDKRITGQGVKWLRKANVTVEFFPSDLAGEVEELNRDFTRERERQRAVEEDVAAEKDRVIEAQRQEIAELRRKPYEEALQKKVEILLSNLTVNGRLLLRHLLENEPLEVGRTFIQLIPSDVQSDQMIVAVNSGIVRLKEVRTGGGNIIRTDYAITDQYRAALRDLLYRNDH